MGEQPPIGRQVAPRSSVCLGYGLITGSTIGSYRYALAILTSFDARDGLLPSAIAQFHRKGAFGSP